MFFLQRGMADLVTYDSESHCVNSYTLEGGIKIGEIEMNSNQTIREGHMGMIRIEVTYDSTKKL